MENTKVYLGCYYKDCLVEKILLLSYDYVLYSKDGEDHIDLDVLEIKPTIGVNANTIIKVKNLFTILFLYDTNLNKSYTIRLDNNFPEYYDARHIIELYTDYDI
jgi:hypothetical protein